jgi:ABC-2 type transport system ATP-binding protein
LIDIHQVTRSFKNHVAIHNLTLHVPQNEYLALLGPNGAGKTTLVEMIEGLQAPNKGTITISGKTWERHERFLRKIIGLSLQETKFVDKLTVLETLDLFGSFYGLARPRSREVMALVGLEEKKNSYTANLSGGQRQKLALGVALLNQPRLLLLDEPTTGLDPNARREIWEILTGLKRDGQTTLILTTHYMEEAQYLCDRIVVLDQGQILADGTLEELLNTFAAGELIEFEVREPIAPSVPAQLPGYMSQHWTVPGRKGTVTVESITEALPVLLALLETQGAEILSFQCRKKTLEDLFVAMTGRRLDE